MRSNSVMIQLIVAAFELADRMLFAATRRFWRAKPGRRLPARLAID
jgi:hypothetical protein